MEIEPTMDTAGEAWRPHVLMLWGDFTFVQDWALAASRSADVTLALEAPPRQALRSIVPTAKRTGIATVPIGRLHLRPSRIFGPSNVAFEARQIVRTARALQAEGRKVDCLHTHFFSNALGPLAAARRLRVPVIHTEHSSALVSRELSPRAAKGLRLVAAHSAVLFAVSDDLASAVRRYGVSREPVVLPNPVDLEMFSRTPIGMADHQRCPRRLVTAGWLIPRKNHEIIVEALAVIADDLDVVLDVIGDGVLEDALRDRAASLGLSERIRFLGRLDRRRVAEVFGKADAYVHASQAETFGVTLVEAWASGLPVVTFDCGGVSAIANDFGGEVVSERTPEAMAEALRRVLARASNSQRQAIREHAVARFSTHHAESVLASAYRQAVSSTGG
jgi:glycosyltransferase involved in cell wall biosynthesis